MSPINLRILGLCFLWRFHFHLAGWKDININSLSDDHVRFDHLHNFSYKYKYFCPNICLWNISVEWGKSWDFLEDIGGRVVYLSRWILWWRQEFPWWLWQEPTNTQLFGFHFKWEQPGTCSHPTQDFGEESRNVHKLTCNIIYFSILELWTHSIIDIP